MCFYVYITLLLTQVLALDHSVHLMEDDSVEILVNALVCMYTNTSQCVLVTCMLVVNRYKVW